MLVDFLFHLRRCGLAVSTTEFLALLEVVARHLPGFDVTRFHLLARTCLIKDESLYDRFDLAFASYLTGVECAFEGWGDALPEDWLRAQAERYLSEDDRRALRDAARWEDILDRLRQRLAEQSARHAGGNRYIGTGGSSPFGAAGDHPAGVRMGQDGGRRDSAVKVWEERAFRDFDASRGIGTREIKLALRRLRRFAREGAADEFDLDETIRATARDGGVLHVRQRPSRRNAVRLLLFLDVGGSMDRHVQVVEELFSAARAEFAQLEYFYFHNCLYERVWRNNRRRREEYLDTRDVLRRYGRDYRVVIVGDASMSPWELSHPGGSVEHWNEEPGLRWLSRLADAYPRLVWLNPLPEAAWGRTPSIGMVQETLPQRMFPLTLAGLDGAVRCLMRGRGPATP